ncbi:MULTISPECIES: hypothetical protein [unclassified Alcanivorax]|uniref:hypothetical protein n=1 Tax=Alcanivorax TaxID=59753 RepID=UPI000A559917|nr:MULTISPECIES: hypothetical protein [unclassified Alcanivorax]
MTTGIFYKADTTAAVDQIRHGKVVGRDDRSGLRTRHRYSPPALRHHGQYPAVPGVGGNNARAGGVYRNQQSRHYASV